MTITLSNIEAGKYIEVKSKYTPLYRFRVYKIVCIYDGNSDIANALTLIKIKHKKHWTLVTPTELVVKFEYIPKIKELLQWL